MSKTEIYFILNNNTLEIYLFSVRQLLKYKGNYIITKDITEIIELQLVKFLNLQKDDLPVIFLGIESDCYNFENILTSNFKIKKELIINVRNIIKKAEIIFNSDYLFITSQILEGNDFYDKKNYYEAIQKFLNCYKFDIPEINSKILPIFFEIIKNKPDSITLIKIYDEIYLKNCFFISECNNLIDSLESDEKLDMFFLYFAERTANYDVLSKIVNKELLSSEKKDEEDINEDLKEILKNADNLFIKKSYKEAFDLYKEAEKYDSSKAYNCIGFCYEKGYGTLKNIKKALGYYQKSSDMGNSIAVFNLGKFYCETENKTEIEKGLELIQKSALMYNKKAMIFLHNHYLFNEDNYKEAKIWLFLSTIIKEPKDIDITNMLIDYLKWGLDEVCVIVNDSYRFKKTICKTEIIDFKKYNTNSNKSNINGNEKKQTKINTQIIDLAKCKINHTETVETEIKAVQTDEIVKKIRKKNIKRRQKKQKIRIKNKNK